jgi:transcriptional regulator with XRE-family HTH domain
MPGLPDGDDMPAEDSDNASPPDKSSDGSEQEPIDDVRLGDLLREARLSRALTLADVERDTRINREYLEALEHERYEVLPAPVYARGFLRSYARHLGLDVEETCSLLPTDLPRPPDLEPLPGLRRVPRTALPAINGPRAAAVFAAVAVVLLLVFATSRIGGDGGVAAPEPAPADVTPDATATPAGDAPPAESPGPAGTVPPFEVGETPNFIGVDREAAQALLTQLGLQFVVIEVATDEAPAGAVFRQAPDPGSPIEAGDSVTLIVSSGPSP